MHHIGDIDFDAAPELEPLPTPDVDPSNNECQEEWLAIATHRQQLIRLGVDLTSGVVTTSWWQAVLNTQQSPLKQDTSVSILLG